MKTKKHPKYRVIRAKKKYKDKIYETPFIGYSYRDENAMPRTHLECNISFLPPQAVAAVEQALKQQAEIAVGKLFSYKASLPIGDVWAVHQLATQLGIPRALEPLGEKDTPILLSMIYDRVLNPKPRSKRALRDAFPDGAVARILGNPPNAALSQWYEALDHIYEHQDRMQKSLFQSGDGRMFLYDITSTYFEGVHCPLAAFGYNRDGKKGKLQIVVGLMCDAQGRPVAVEVFKGNTSDQTTVVAQIHNLREKFGVKNLVFIGDRGMLTEARIEEVESWAETNRIDYITALTRSRMMELVEDEDTPFQIEMFDTKNLAAVHYEGRRYILCHNPLRRERDETTRERLLALTEKKLAAIAANVAAGRLKRRDAVAKRLFRWLNRWGMEKFFIVEYGEGKFSFQRNEETLARYRALDGCYVLATSLDENLMESAEVLRRYKSLARVEQAFRTMKTEDLFIRPIRHWSETRVRGHVFVCMLAYLLIHEARRRLAPLLERDDRRYTPWGSLREIREQLQKITIGKFTVNGNDVEQLSMIPDAQRQILKTLGVRISPKLLSIGNRP
jgi:transposase